MKRSGIFLLLTSIAFVSSCGEPTPSGGGGSSSTGYTITWKNYNGAVLKVDKDVKENTIPKYTGATPTRPDDSSYTYSWSGWTPKVVAATANATYTATYTSTPKGGGDPEKVIVSAHKLKTTNPPVDIYSDPGQQVSESTWNSFKNGGKSKFINNYDYTYVAYYSSSNYQMELFTKNGYEIDSYLNGKYNCSYYEKIGSTTYSYTSATGGYLRSETSAVDIEDKYTYRIIEELKVHMFGYSEYTYDPDFEIYRYNGVGSTSYIKFQKGYLTELMYKINDTCYYHLSSSFCTEIEIPQSYYYK